MGFRPLIWGPQTCISNEDAWKGDERLGLWPKGEGYSSTVESAVKVKMHSGIKLLVGVVGNNTFDSSHVRLAHVVTI